ncbi:hypothetical protein FO488_02315 [Geobacter sp. FeAm09]|uniref:hypothetical protein n=1 Tax=Geobacter sp. FeAm09 TaxID=2597769 RepID=UPI0011EF851D|nr:hypothetical protein [Geobacter sp. FeAm09]QEM67108.1 hypothetical protein FO488_02315 [Geobacter sp. FeAm09]
MSVVSRQMIVIPLMMAAAMLVQPVSGLPATSAAGSDYEIPLSELKKVEKKKAKKAETRKRAERKRVRAAAQETTRAASEPAGAPAAQPVPAPPAPRSVEAAPETPDSVHISHEPYSYVVPGKRTIVKAVVSLDGVQAVRCRFRAGEKGGDALVSMTRAPGSQFTYGATLPPLESGAMALRYRFIVVDATGHEIHSREFVTPVKITPVVPGWQQDPAGEPVRAVLENPRQPLEGFSGVVMENAERK